MKLKQISVIGIALALFLCFFAPGIDASTIKKGYEKWSPSTVSISGSSIIVKVNHKIDKKVKTSNISLTDSSNKVNKSKITINKDYASLKVTPSKALSSGKEYRIYIQNAKGSKKSAVIPFIYKKITTSSSKYVKKVKVYYSKIITNLSVQTTKEVFSIKVNQKGKYIVGHYKGAYTYEVALAKASKGEKVTIYLYNSKNKLIGKQDVKL